MSIKSGVEGYGLPLVNSAVGKLLMTLNSPVFKSEESDELGKLQGYVRDIQDMIADEVEHPRYWIADTKKIVYEAEDIFECLLVEFDDQRSQVSTNNCFTTFIGTFHKRRKLGLAVKNICKRMDSIVRHGRSYCPRSSKPRGSKRKGKGKKSPGSTCYVVESSIIGRKKELEEIVRLLLNPEDEKENVSVICIVGLGGLGKTALAQLVYHDDRVANTFESRIWVCASDYSDSDSRISKINLFAMLSDILCIASNFRYPFPLPLDLQHSSEQHLINLVSQELQGKRYLLVLDDVWSEDANLLQQLLIPGGATGSMILVTTRSQKTALCLRSRSYFLNGLTDEDSWELFNCRPLDTRSSCYTDLTPLTLTPHLVDCSRGIIKQCCNIPLALRLARARLCNRPESHWSSFLETNVHKKLQGLMTVLKLSYYALPSPLRTCFSFCALFPKGFEIQKDVLIRLWMAHGYIVSCDHQSFEEYGEECFLTLLHRGFFVDVKRDEYCEIVSFKVHDLMHDIAQEAAGKEISVVNSLPQKLEQNIHHIFQAAGDFESLFIHTKLRSYLQDGLKNQFPVSIKLSNRMCLRVLDLHNLGIKSLPHSLGTLKLLRYLDLSQNDAITVLPSSLTQLYNLQTLNLRDCVSLSTLPKDFSNLLSLRFLDIYGCGLTHMPLGMEKLMCLRVLTEFVVAERDSIERQFVGQLKDLQALVKLKGSIDILIPDNDEIADKDKEEGYLSKMQDIKKIRLKFIASDSIRKMHEDWLKMLLPHSDLKEFTLIGYQGDRISWKGRQGDLMTFLLPKLVKVELVSCKTLQQIPLLSKLPHLRSLTLEELTSLEYMEEENSKCGDQTSESISPDVFYPSLKRLHISMLYALKGWTRGRGIGDQPQFACLSELLIQGCPKLTSFPPCPLVDTLRVSELNENLQIVVGKPDMELVELDNIHYLKSLSIVSAVKIHIRGTQELKSLSEVVEVLSSYSSLQTLTIEDCPNLSYHSGRLEHPTTTVLESEEDDHKNDIFWKSLQSRLRVLELKKLRNLSELPCEMQYLTSLQTLTIDDCGLRCLPDWIGLLSSLRCLRIISCVYLRSLPLGMMNLTTSLYELEIRGSPELLVRCRKPNGVDWPMINLVPVINMSE